MARAATDPRDIPSRSSRGGVKILLGQHGPVGTIRKAATVHRHTRGCLPKKVARRRGRTNYGLVGGPFLSGVEVKEVLERVGAEAIPTMRQIASREFGDGKIFILPVDEVIRIRTGERGKVAI